MGLYLTKYCFRLSAEEPVKIEKIKTPKQTKLIKDLETAAENYERTEWTVSQDHIHFCVHMLDTHGLEWKAMARDRKKGFISFITLFVDTQG